MNVETPYDSVSKTLTTDERKVVDVLTSHNGQYLQKYVRAETGLSRLKIHRIVTRLVRERHSYVGAVWKHKQSTSLKLAR